MKLKTKLTLAVSLLVLVVVLAVNLVYLSAVVKEQTQEVYDHADFLAREVYNEMSQELTAAHDAGRLGGDPAAALRQFFLGLRGSPAMKTLFSSAIGYPVSGAVRDVALVAPDGIIALDSNAPLEGTPQPQRRLLLNVVNSGAREHFKAVFGAERVYSVELTTQVGTQTLGSIVVNVDTVLLRQAMLARIRALAEAGAAIVLLATLLALGLAEFILAPLSSIRAQLDQLTGAPRAAAEEPGAAMLERRDEFGTVSSKIQQLGRQMRDVRQVYSALQENVTHVLEGLEEGLLLFDATGHSVMASAATPRLLGLAPEGIVGQTVEALFPSGSGLDRAVRLAVRQRVGLASREVERHPGGRPLLARLDLLPGAGGQAGALLTVRDAEPVHRLENELEVARRLSAVGRLTRGVAHEVKNPLNAMAIHLDLLREKAGPRAAALLPHIDVIRREIERLDRVVRTFLDFSRPVELQLAAADLGELARGVGNLVRAGAEERGLAVAVEAPARGPGGWLDRDLVEQALLNLVNNGLQAMGETPGSGRRLELSVYELDQQAVVRVRDEGPGIPAEAAEKIFDLYFTTRAEGTGIGLALAARIMQLHHGSIELEQGRRGGASFLLRFPLRSGPGEAG